MQSRGLDGVIHSKCVQAQITDPTEAGSVFKCVEAVSACAAVSRSRALCGLHRLSGPLRAAIVPGDESPTATELASIGWTEWPHDGAKSAAHPAAAPPHAYLAILVESRARVVTAGSDRSFFL